MYFIEVANLDDRVSSTGAPSFSFSGSQTNTVGGSFSLSVSSTDKLIGTYDMEYCNEKAVYTHNVPNFCFNQNINSTLTPVGTDHIGSTGNRLRVFTSYELGE